MEKFAERLRALRIQKKLSVLGLSKIVGIGASAISKWEKSQRNIKRCCHLIILAKYFDVSTDYLLGLEE